MKPRLRIPFPAACAAVLLASLIPAACAAVLLAPLIAMSPARAEESLSAALGLESGACFDAGAVHSTRSVSAEYRRAVERSSGHAYVRHAPAGLDCTQDGLTVDLGAERRWGDEFYAVAQFAADQVAVVGSYSLEGEGAVWRYLVDGTPTYAAALGVGREWGSFSAEIGANAVPTDWVDGESHGVRFTLAWGPELFGGDLLLEAVTEAGRRNSGLARWTRSFGEGPLGLVIAYRYEGGLDELASPFAETLDGGWVLAPAASSTEVLDIGLTWAID